MTKKEFPIYEKEIIETIRELLVGAKKMRNLGAMKLQVNADDAEANALVMRAYHTEEVAELLYSKFFGKEKTFRGGLGESELDDNV